MLPVSIFSFLHKDLGWYSKQEKLFHSPSESRNTLIGRSFFQRWSNQLREAETLGCLQGQKIREIPPETDGERNTQGRDEEKQKVQKESKRQELKSSGQMKWQVHKTRSRQRPRGVQKWEGRVFQAINTQRMLSLGCKYSEILAFLLMSADRAGQTQTQGLELSHSAALHTQNFFCAVCTVNLSSASIPRGALVHGKLVFHSPFHYYQPHWFQRLLTLLSVRSAPLNLLTPCSWAQTGPNSPHLQQKASI